MAVEGGGCGGVRWCSGSGSGEEVKWWKDGEEKRESRDWIDGYLAQEYGWINGCMDRC